MGPAKAISCRQQGPIPSPGCPSWPSLSCKLMSSVTQSLPESVWMNFRQLKALPFRWQGKITFLLWSINFVSLCKNAISVMKRRPDGAQEEKGPITDEGVFAWVRKSGCWSWLWQLCDLGHIPYENTTLYWVPTIHWVVYKYEPMYRCACHVYSKCPINDSY